MKIKYLLLVLVCMIMGSVSLNAIERNVVDPMIEINRVKLEETLEDRLKNRLKSILQDEYVFVIVKVRLAGEEISFEAQEEADDGYALPGVPVEQNLTSKKEPRSVNNAPRFSSKIANVYAWIFVSKDIPKESLEKAKSLSSEILGIDLTRGDTLTIEAYLKEISLWEELQSSEVLVKLIAMALLIIAAVAFLFGPLGVFLKRSTPLSNPLGGNIQMSVNAAPNTANTGGLQGFSSAPEAITKSFKQSNVKEKFSYVNSSNVEDLAYILSESSVEDAIILLNNVDSVLAGRIFSYLNSAKQKELISQQKEVKYLNSDLVKSAEERIGKKVENIFGGSQKISQFLQACNTNVKDGMLAWLKESDASFAAKVMKNLIALPDLVNYDSQSFRKIFRTAGLESFAIVLSGQDPGLIEQFKAKLNEDIVLLLNDQMKITTPSKNKIIEEETKILDNVIKLIKSGDLEPLEGKELS